MVSKGRAPIQVPNLVGKNINDARGQLQSLGLTAVERYKDSDQPADQVIAQTPKPGTGAANDAEVTLDVSKGPPQVTVPDVQQPAVPAGAAGAAAGSACRSQIVGLQPERLRPRAEPGRPNTQVPPQTAGGHLQCF